MPTTTCGAETGHPAPTPTRLPAGRRYLGTEAGVLGGEGLAAYLHSALGEALAAADVIVPLATALVLRAAILRGSTQTCERVFRLLRWVANRPEPPAPERPGSDQAAAQMNATGLEVSAAAPRSPS